MGFVQRMKKNAAILIVEPDKPLAARLASAFEHRGANVSVAHSFQKARDTIEQEPLDIVLCATHLEKGTDGIAVLEQVQKK